MTEQHIERIARGVLGGRPMKCIERCRFIDRVSGKSVGLYQDRLGVRWLAEGPWSLFRVRAYLQEQVE